MYYYYRAVYDPSASRPSPKSSSFVHRPKCFRVLFFLFFYYVFPTVYSLLDSVPAPPPSVIFKIFVSPTLSVGLPFFSFVSTHRLRYSSDSMTFGDVSHTSTKKNRTIILVLHQAGSEHCFHFSRRLSSTSCPYEIF